MIALVSIVFVFIKLFQATIPFFFQFLAKLSSVMTMITLLRRQLQFHVMFSFLFFSSHVNKCFCFYLFYMLSILLF